jgi:hypothetical protein
VPGHEIVGRSLKDGSAVTTFSRAISRRLTPGGVDKGKKIGVAGLAGPGHTAVKIAHVLAAQVVVFTTSLVMITHACVAFRSPSAFASVAYLASRLARSASDRVFVWFILEA